LARAARLLRQAPPDGDVAQARQPGTNPSLTLSRSAMSGVRAARARARRANAL